MLAGPLMPRVVAERVGDAVLPGVAAQACAPAGLAGLLRRLADESHSGSGFALLANHPAPEERLSRS